MAKKNMPVECSDCEGEGEVLHRSGFFALRGKCEACDGQGTKTKPSPEQELKDKLLR